MKSTTKEKSGDMSSGTPAEPGLHGSTRSTAEGKKEELVNEGKAQKGSTKEDSSDSSDSDSDSESEASATAQNAKTSTKVTIASAKAKKGSAKPRLRKAKSKASNSSSDSDHDSDSDSSASCKVRKAKKVAEVKSCSSKSSSSSSDSDSDGGNSASRKVQKTKKTKARSKSSSEESNSSSSDSSSDSDSGSREKTDSPKKSRAKRKTRKGKPSIPLPDPSNLEKCSTHTLTGKDINALPCWAYLIVEDKHNKRTWHLPVRDKEGKINKPLLSKVRQSLITGKYKGRPLDARITQRVRNRINHVFRIAWPGLPEPKFSEALLADEEEEYDFEGQDHHWLSATQSLREGKLLSLSSK